MSRVWVKTILKLLKFAWRYQGRSLFPNVCHRHHSTEQASLTPDDPLSAWRSPRGDNRAHLAGPAPSKRLPSEARGCSATLCWHCVCAGCWVRRQFCPWPAETTPAVRAQLWTCGVIFLTFLGASHPLPPAHRSPLAVKWDHPFLHSVYHLLHTYF